MFLKTAELTSIFISALVAGMYWGPWLALTRSIKTFDAPTFLTIVKRLNKNMAVLMTVLTPLSLLSILPVLFFSYAVFPIVFYCFLSGFICFFIALLVTVMIEVPLVKEMVLWTEKTLPQNWQQVRNRWLTFHPVRVFFGMIGLILLLAGVIFQ